MLSHSWSMCKHYFPAQQKQSRHAWHHGRSWMPAHLTSLLPMARPVSVRWGSLARPPRVWLCPAIVLARPNDAEPHGHFACHSSWRPSGNLQGTGSRWDANGFTIRTIPLSYHHSVTRTSICGSYNFLKSKRSQQLLLPHGILKWVFFFLASLPPPWTSQCYYKARWLKCCGISQIHGVR